MNLNIEMRIFNSFICDLMYILYGSMGDIYYDDDGTILHNMGNLYQMV
jgi:hypothetical protein